MTLSILATTLDFIALVWSIYLVVRYRDWRLCFLACILGIFVYRETATLVPAIVVPAAKAAAFSGTGELRLTAAVSAILVVFAIDRLFAERNLVFASLQRSEIRYHLLVDTIPHGILEVDPSGHITFCNSAVEKLLGFTTAELRGRFVWELCRSSYEADELRQYIERLLANQTTSLQHLAGYTRRDSTRVDLQSDWNFRRNVYGQIIGLVAVVTDVTEKQRTERVLQSIVQGTASSTGVDFFRSLVRHLADALQVKTAFVMERLDDDTGRYLALWNGDHVEDPHPYPLTGSVHADVVRQGFLSIRSGVSEQFPQDHWVCRHPVECYMALSLYDATGTLVGLMGVMNDAPLQGSPIAETVLRIFAARAAVELQRKQAEEAVRQSEAKLRTIVQEMPVMMWAFDDEENIVAWNRECEAVSGYPAERIVGNPQAMKMLYPDEAQQSCVLDDWSSTGPDFRNRESTMTTSTGQRRLVEWSRTSRRVPIAGWSAWGIGVDVTDRQRAEEQRRRSEAKSRALLDAIPDVMLQIDGKFRCTDFKSSKSAGPLILVNEVIGRQLTEIFPEEVARRLQESVQKARTSDEVEGFEFKRLQGSATRAYEVRIARTNAGDFLCIFRDVTDRARLQKEILEISGREQRRIGQDLHDGLGQLLTAIAFLAHALQQRLEESAGDEAESAEQIVKLVYDAIAKTRSIARGLCPIHVEENGLISALQDLAADVETLYGIRCDFECPIDLSIEDTMVATHLYRIAQEAVTNALRHGDAKHVRLLLNGENGHCVLTVTDDGIGVPCEKGERKGLGFSIMNYRATMIGGTLEVCQGPNGGTVVRCPFPRTAGEKVAGAQT